MSRNKGPQPALAVAPEHEPLTGREWVVVLLLVSATLIVDACGAAFLYKVWNERQLTYAGQRQAAAQEELVSLFEDYAREARLARLAPPAAPPSPPAPKKAPKRRAAKRVRPPEPKPAQQWYLRSPGCRNDEAPCPPLVVEPGVAR